MSTYLLLWFEAPLQSWGADSAFLRRDTLPFPTKSGVLGLLFCSAGLSGSQEDTLAQFRTCRQDVFAFASPNAPMRRLEDFHMVGSGYDGGDKWQKLFIPKTLEGEKPNGPGIKLTHRFYIQNGHFAVLCECPNPYGDIFSQSLRNPVFDIYLGRKNCVPSDFVFRGVFHQPTDAVEEAKRIATDKHLQLVFSVHESMQSEDDEKFVIRDVPLSFGQRKVYTERNVFLSQPANT